MLYGDKSNDYSVIVVQGLIKESSSELLLIKDSQFETHTQQLCVKDSQQLHALARVSHFMDSKKLVAIMNAFIMEQVSYCPLIWMFHSRKTDHKINRIHERALRLAYTDDVSTFEQLLAKNNSVTTHESNPQLLMTEIFKINQS